MGTGNVAIWGCDRVRLPAQLLGLTCQELTTAEGTSESLVSVRAWWSRCCPELVVLKEDSLASRGSRGPNSVCSPGSCQPLPRTRPFSGLHCFVPTGSGHPSLQVPPASVWCFRGPTLTHAKAGGLPVSSPQWGPWGHECLE